jgi:protein TonB
LVEVMRLALAVVAFMSACLDRPPEAAAPSARGSPVAPPSQTPTIVSDVDCRFPDEAEALGIDEADVVVRVTVAPSGAAEGAEIVHDPGHGFRDAALECVLSARYVPAVNPAGKTIRAITRPFKVHFSRSGSK